MARRPGCIVPAASHRTVASPACAGRLLTTERQVLLMPSPFSFEQLFRRLHVAPIRAFPHRSTPAWSRARTAKATISSGRAATATETGHLQKPRSPERGFVMVMACLELLNGQKPLAKFRISATIPTPSRPRARRMRMSRSIPTRHRQRHRDRPRPPLRAAWLP